MKLKPVGLSRFFKAIGGGSFGDWLGKHPFNLLLRRGNAELRNQYFKAKAFRLVGPSLSPFEAWQSVNKLTSHDRAELYEELSSRAGHLPRISLITPVYNTDPALFEELVQSVLAQVHQDWELCIVNDASPSAHVMPMLEKAAARDSRIRVRTLERNGGISVATNAAVEMATGEYVAFLDHDDLITPDCLAEFGLLLADAPETDMAYSDDDKIDANGRRYAPQFKPDWSPVLLLSFMYISHMFVVRRSIFRELGGFRSEFDGSQDYDFALRAAEVVRKVGHIPRILYHWRAVEGSTAVSAEGKPNSLEAGRRAVEEALVRRGITGAQAIHPDWASKAKVGRFEVAFPDDGPSVCIIIPTNSGLGSLKRCLQSLERTTYRNFKVMVVDSGSDDADTTLYLESLRDLGRVRVATSRNPDGEFNHSRIINEAVGQTDADFVLFLNDDVEVQASSWLSQMIGYALMEGVGAVGARLYSGKGAIHHAGLTHGHNEGLVGLAFRGAAPRDWGYLGLIRASRECAGVTAACLLTRRSLFDELGGFGAEAFPVSYNDADFCHRLAERGLSSVYASNAELFQHRVMRSTTENLHELINYRLRYRNLADRCYNPNLSLENERFIPANIRPQSRRNGPVRVLGITHDLNNEGAPTTFFDLCVAMKESGLVDPIVLSPVDGPLRKEYEVAGIRVIVGHSDFRRIKSRRALESALGELVALIRDLEVEVVLANTLRTFWGVLGARQAKVPAVWCQHESEAWPTYYNYLPADVRRLAYRGFSYAYRILYVADATRRDWQALETCGNFGLIRHGIPQKRLAAETERWSRAAARQAFDVKDDQLCIVIVGTVSRRKGQLDVVRAIAHLPEELKKKLVVFIVGHVSEADYGRDITKAIGNTPAARVELTGRVEDPFVYYSLADIAVCTSRIESAPRVLVEAMACGLPIITTPAFGIPELVRPDVNALFYKAGDVRALAAAISRLWQDRELRGKFAQNSPLVLASLPSFETMVEKYCKVIREAANLEY